MQRVAADKYITREERKTLLQKNDWIATYQVIKHWLWIVAAFALAYYWTNPLSIILALWILGGKQLACAILMHDTSHNSMFNNNRLNDFVGQWLGAYPIFQNLKRYRPYHLKHHQFTGLTNDPDLLLTRGYPTTTKSMFRKFFRDLTGQTGIKAFTGLLLMNLGYVEYNLGGKVVKINQQQRTWRAFFKRVIDEMGGGIVANLLMLGIFYSIGATWLYLLWIVAYLTTFQFCLRIRSMAEHAMVEEPTNPILNTRTTKANFLERLLFAPYHVNYHAEHHMLMGVPSYSLPRMHQLLKKRAYYKKGVMASGYVEVIRQAMQKTH